MSKIVTASARVDRLWPPEECRNVYRQVNRTAPTTFYHIIRNNENNDILAYGSFEYRIAERRLQDSLLTIVPVVAIRRAIQTALFNSIESAAAFCRATQLKNDQGNCAYA